MPICVCSVANLLHSAYRNKNFIEMLPLLFSQLNSLLIWICLFCSEIGYYYSSTSRVLQVKGDLFRNISIRYFIGYADFLEPITIFLYTWQLLEALEERQTNPLFKKINKWYRKISIFLVPSLFLSVFIAIVIVNS